MQMIALLFAFFAAAALLQQPAVAAPIQPPQNDSSQLDDQVAGESSDDAVVTSRDTEIDNTGDNETEMSPRRTSVEPPVYNYILSMGTGMFLAVTKSGRVHANARPGKQISQFQTMFRQIDGREHVSMKSVRYDDRGWYITVDAEDTIRGTIPVEGNEIFEVMNVGGTGSLALKLRRSGTTSSDGEEDEDGSGDGSLAPTTCYLGFSVENGRPSCYDSYSHIETHFTFTPYSR